MPSDTRFIPITISLDGSQAAADFKQFTDGITSAAKQVSQSIIDANKKAYDEMILANQKAFAQFRATQLQTVDIAKESLAIQDQFLEKIEGTIEAIAKLSEEFGHLSEALSHSGEGGESLLTKYHEATASIVYSIEILKTGHELLKSIFGGTKESAAGMTESLEGAAGEMGELAAAAEAGGGALAAFAIPAAIVIGALVAIAAAAAITGKVLYDVTKQSFEKSRELADLSRKNNLNAETMATLSIGAGQSKEDLDRVSEGVRKFNEYVIKAGNGSREAAAQLQEFGVKQADIDREMAGDGQPALEHFLDALGKTPDAIEKVNGPLKTLGGPNGALKKVMDNLSTKTIEEAQDKFRSLGLVMGETGNAKAKQFSDALYTVGVVSDSVKRKFAEEAGPAFTKILGLISTALLNNKDVIDLVAVVAGKAIDFIAKGLITIYGKARVFFEYVRAGQSELEGLAHKAQVLSNALANGFAGVMKVASGRDIAGGLKQVRDAYRSLADELEKPLPENPSLQKNLESIKIQMEKLNKSEGIRFSSELGGLNIPKRDHSEDPKPTKHYSSSVPTDHRKEMRELEEYLRARVEPQKELAESAKEEVKIRELIIKDLEYHHRKLTKEEKDFTAAQLLEVDKTIDPAFYSYGARSLESVAELRRRENLPKPPSIEIDSLQNAPVAVPNIGQPNPIGLPVNSIAPPPKPILNTYSDAIKQLNDQFQQGLHLTQTQTLELRIQRGEFGAISDEQAKGLLSLSRSVEEQQKFEEKAKKIKETLVNAFEQGLQHGPKAFFKSLFDSFKQTIVKMESEWAASKVMQFLFPTKSGTAAGHPGSNGNPIQSVIDHIQNQVNQSADGSSSAEATQSGIQKASSLSKIPAAGNFLKGLPVIGKLFDHGSKTAANAVAGKASSLAGNALGAMKSGAGAATSASGGILSKLGMAGMFSNPFTAAAAIAPIALPFIMKLFGGGVEKAIKSEVKKDYNVDIKDSKILQQIKSIGDQTYGKQLSSHIPQLVAMDQVKQIVTQYGMYADPNFFNTKLGQTKHLTDIDANANQFTRRAMGGPVGANMPYLVGEKRPELFIPRVDGAIHPDPIGEMTRRVMDGARSKMSAETGNQGHSTNGLAYAIQSLVEQVSRLTAISPGQVLQTGAQQNPTAISGGLIEGLRQNFGHRRELNGITGA